MLELKGLTRRYGSTVALDELSLQVPEGEVVGFVGPNGAGKTTAMRIALGVLEADAGEVVWRGEPATRAVQSGFGYMPEERGLYPKMHVDRQLRYLATLHGRAEDEAGHAAARWIERLGPHWPSCFARWWRHEPGPGELPRRPPRVPRARALARVSDLDRADAGGGEGDDGDEGVAFVAALLLYMQLILYGIAVASGVVEEKASRVVEVLLAAIPPRARCWQGRSRASGCWDCSSCWPPPWWASLYAMAGAIVSRQEDLQSSTTVLTVLLVVCYLLAFPVLDDPDSGLAVITSLVPFSSPIVMPTRVAGGAASATEIAASLGLLVVATALLVPAGARIYENAVLRMGKPLKLIEAWRGSATAK